MRTDRIPAGGVRDGTALIASMGLVMLVASTSFLVSTVLVSDFKAQGRRADSAALLVTAESAANQAYDYYQRNTGSMPTIAKQGLGSPWIDDPAIFPSGATINGMAVSTQITLLEDTKPGTWGYQTYLLEARATAGDKTEPERYGRRIVQMLIKPQTINVFPYGVGGKNGFDWMGSASFDCYNSQNGPYALPPGRTYVDNNGGIASNGQLNVDNTQVYGSHTSYANMFMPQLSYDPPVTATTVTAGAGGGIAATYIFHNPGTFHTASITIGKNDILRVEGGGTVTLYVDGQVYFDGAQLQFDNTSSTLVLYQNDYSGSATTGFKLNGNTNIGEVVPVYGGAATQQSRPAQFQWYSMYKGEMSFNGTAQISCALYAPSATVSANGTFDFMGALICNSFATDVGQGKVNGNFKVHYDTSLGGLSPNLQPRLQVAGWYTRLLAYSEP